MKKQTLSEEFKRMQKLAGIINENEDSTYKSKVDWYYISDESNYPGPKGRVVPNAEGYDNPKDYKGTELYISKGTTGSVINNKFIDDEDNDAPFSLEYFEKV